MRHNAGQTSLPTWNQNKVLLVFGLAAWCLMLVLPTRLPLPRPDPSWQAVLNYAAAHHLQHGTDIVFTYGPLGYLAEDSFATGTWLRVTLFQCAIHALYILLLVRLLAVTKHRGSFSRGQQVLFAFAAVWFPAIDKDAFYVLLISFIGMPWLLLRGDAAMAAGHPPPAELNGAAAEPSRLVRSGLLDWLGIGALGILSLIKTTYLAYALVVVALVIGRLLLNRGRWLALAVAALFVGGFLCSWSLLAQQELAHVGLWLRGTGEAAVAYQQAMGGWNGWGIFARGLLVLALFARLLLEPFRRNREVIFTTLMLLAGAALAWKQSFTRADEHHAVSFFVCAIVMAGLLPLATDSQPRRVLLSLLVVLSVWGGLFQKLLLPISRAWENARWVLALPQKERIWADRAQEYDLPEIRRMVGSARVDVQGWEQAIAILNGLNYCPPPVFQAYAAGTPYLARLNAAFYQSTRAPEFVLSRGSTIDERIPNLDASRSGLILAQQYRPVLSERGYQLLRRASGIAKPIQPGCAGTVSLDELLPAAAGQWIEVSMRENWLGRLVRVLWASPPVFIEVGREADVPVTYRFVPSMAISGFVVPEGTVSLKLKRSRVAVACFRSAISYRLYDTPIALD